MVKDTVALNGRSRRVTALPAVALTSLVFATTSARAEEEALLDPAAPEAALVPATAEPMEIVVVGDPPARSAGEARLDRDILEAAPQRSGSDLLRHVPGMFVSQHSGEGKAHQLFFRGFDAVHGQDLEVTVAGVPVNEVSNVHGQGYADLHFVIPEVVERIQARPGALRADQGDFAVAGSVLYDLGYDEPGVSVSVGLGSFGARRLLLAYHPEGAPAATFGAVELYSTSGFGPARAGERTSAIGQVEHELGGNLALRVQASTYAGRFDSAGVVRQRDLDAGLVDRFATYDADQGGVSNRTQLAMQLSHADHAWRSSFMPYVVLRELKLRSNFTGRLQTGTSDNTLQSNASTTVGFRASVQKRLDLVDADDGLEVGVFTRHDRIQQTQRFTEGELPASVDASVLATDIGAYVDLGLYPWKRAALHLGLRADGLAYTVNDRLAQATRSAQGTHLGPKLTIDVAIAPGVRALGGYGTGFRSPQARSLGDGEKTPFTEVQGFDAGLLFADGSLEASLAGFATFLDNDLVFDEATSRNEPAPPTLRMGTTLSFQARSGEWFLSACGASYTRATFRKSGGRYAEGDLVPFVPEYVGRCDLSVTQPLGSWRHDPIVLRVGGGMDMLLNRPLPYGEQGSDVFLLGALLKLAHGPLELGLEGENLLGAEWYDGEFVYASDFPEVPPSALPERHVTAGAPRSFMATLSLQL
ncbi:MAG TPA: TonB-dependent receptor [Polyangiaceae bacterium]|nr:TonB-dependent receptor [Polyangiaceae bacterium]